MIQKKTIFAVVAASALFAGSAAFAGKNTVPNLPTALPASVGAAIAGLLNRGSSGTITLTTGQQIFVSITGTLITSSSTSITAATTGGEGIVYSGTSPAIAGFIAAYIADSGGESTDGEVADVIE